MESQRQAVQIEMEGLNGEQCAEPVPSCSSLCLKSGIVLVSVVGLGAVIFTCLLFSFVFWPVCVQDIPSPSATKATGKVNFSCRLPDFKQKGQYDIFRVEKSGTYWIHGWLKRSTDVSEDVLLQHIDDPKEKPRTLEKNNNPGFVLYFNVEVKLMNRSNVSLSVSQLTDGVFYVNEL